MARPRFAGIKRLKAHLSAYVKRAAKGERLLITDRGVVVAELIPHQLEASTTLEQRVLELARAGRCKLAAGFPDAIPSLPKWKPLPRKVPKEVLQRWQDEDRADR